MGREGREGMSSQSRASAGTQKKIKKQNSVFDIFELILFFLVYPREKLKAELSSLLTSNSDDLVQCYIHRPLLYQKKKTGIRHSLFVASFDPLILFTAPGRVIPAPEDYVLGDFHKNTVHTNNYDRTTIFERGLTYQQMNEYLVEEGRVAGGKREGGEGGAGEGGEDGGERAVKELGWWTRELEDKMDYMAALYVHALLRKAGERALVPPLSSFDYRGRTFVHPALFVGVDFLVEDLEERKDHGYKEERFLVGGGEGKAGFKLWWIEAQSPPGMGGKRYVEPMLEALEILENIHVLQNRNLPGSEILQKVKDMDTKEWKFFDLTVFEELFPTSGALGKK
jgi:hypothetical protein